MEQALGLFGQFFGFKHHDEEQAHVEKQPQPQASTTPTTAASAPAVETCAAPEAAEADPIEVDVSQPQVQPTAGNSTADAIEIDVAEPSTQAELATYSTEQQQQQQQASANADADVAMTPATSSEPQPQAEAATAETLLFSYPHPPPSSLRVSELDIHLSASGGELLISGLWPTHAPSSPTLSATSSTSHASRRSRGRSPRRTVVHDVDEAGEEIVPASELQEQAEEEDFVEVHTPQHAHAAEEKSKALKLSLEQAHIDRESIRADLSEEGLKIWARKL
jgi:hypothetical protein